MSPHAVSALQQLVKFITDQRAQLVSDASDEWLAGFDAATQLIREQAAIGQEQLALEQKLASQEGRFNHWLEVAHNLTRYPSVAEVERLVQQYRSEMEHTKQMLEMLRPAPRLPG